MSLTESLANKIPQGYGVFMWNAPERRSNRYGAFYMNDANFKKTSCVTPRLDDLQNMVGKKVNIRCKIVENRESGHCGDFSLKIFPSTPEIGEVIDLGVGFLKLETLDFSPLPAVALVPNDGRSHLWLDPKALYRLHDQTVELFIEETDADFSSPPDIHVSDDTTVIANGDGSFQIKGLSSDDKIRVSPKFISEGDGLFIVSHNYSEGEHIPFEVVKDDKKGKIRT